MHLIIPLNLEKDLSYYPILIIKLWNICDSYDILRPCAAKTQQQRKKKHL